MRRRAHESLNDTMRFLGLHRVGVVLLALSWAALFTVLILEPTKKLPSVGSAKEGLFFAVTVPFTTTALMYVYAFVKVTPERLRREDATAEELSQIDKHEKDRVKGVLKKCLADRRYGVEAAFVFGSIVHDNRSMADIDVGIVFGKCSRRRLRARNKLLETEISPLLAGAFPYPLHWQRFLANESENVKAFLQKAGEYEVLIGDE